MSLNVKEKEQDIKPPAERIRGKITKLSDEGWGFIVSPEMKFIRFFFHWSALKPSTYSFPQLKVGMVVEFNPVNWVEKETQEKKGWRAYHIEVIDNAIEEAKIESLT